MSSIKTKYTGANAASKYNLAAIKVLFVKLAFLADLGILAQLYQSRQYVCVHRRYAPRCKLSASICAYIPIRNNT